MSDIVKEATFQEPDTKERNIEQAKIDGAAKEQEEAKFDPVAAASQIFETYFPIYCKQLDKLSKKQSMRVAKAVMGLPLEEGFKPNVKDKLEMDCYYVAERLHQAKLILFHSILAEKQRKLEEKQAEEAVKAVPQEGEK